MIKKGFRAGGFLGGITSLVLILILKVMDLSSYSAEKIDIFKIIEYAVYLFIALIPGYLLGGVTGGVFSFILMKVQHKGIKFYVITCIAVCVLFLSPLYIYIGTQIIELYRFSSGFLDGHTIMSFEALVKVTIMFSVIYIFTGYFGSLYLYSQFKSSNGAVTSS